jgi:hypothetical protein
MNDHRALLRLPPLIRGPMPPRPRVRGVIPTRREHDSASKAHSIPDRAAGRHHRRHRARPCRAIWRGTTSRKQTAPRTSRAETRGALRGARLDRLQHGGLAFADDMLCSTHRGGGIGWHDLTDHQPVEQMTDCGEPLLHGWSRRRLRLCLEPRGDVQRLHIAERRYSVFLAPGQEQPRRTEGKTRNGI